MDYTKRQKEKMTKLESTIKTFENSNRTPDDYEKFIWGVYPLIKGGEHPLFPETIKKIIEEVVKNK